MMIIKEAKKGRFTLVHSQQTDELGILRDYFELVEEKDGELTHYPFYGLLKINDYSIDQDITDSTVSYTEEDYLQMIDEQVARLVA